MFCHHLKVLIWETYEARGKDANVPEYNSVLDRNPQYNNHPNKRRVPAHHEYDFSFAFFEIYILLQIFLVYSLKSLGSCYFDLIHSMKPFSLATT